MSDYKTIAEFLVPTLPRGNAYRTCRCTKAPTQEHGSQSFLVPTLPRGNAYGI
ncbi:MAG: hypothetical protein L0287_33225 [Anaerolineae bacterium]|nr:hypothetical protein [Anaerolineae bacterium]